MIACVEVNELNDKIVPEQTIGKASSNELGMSQEDILINQAVMSSINEAKA